LLSIPHAAAGASQSISGAGEAGFFARLWESSGRGGGAWSSGRGGGAGSGAASSPASSKPEPTEPGLEAKSETETKTEIEIEGAINMDFVPSSGGAASGTPSTGSRPRSRSADFEVG